MFFFSCHYLNTFAPHIVHCTFIVVNMLTVMIWRLTWISFVLSVSERYRTNRIFLHGNRDTSPGIYSFHFQILSFRLFSPSNYCMYCLHLENRRGKTLVLFFLLLVSCYFFYFFSHSCLKSFVIFCVRVYFFLLCLSLKFYFVAKNLN